MVKQILWDVKTVDMKYIATIAKNNFSFLKEGLPSLKTACAPCTLGTPPNLVIFYTALKPRHRRTSTIIIELVGMILFWQMINTNIYLKRHLH